MNEINKILFTSSTYCNAVVFFPHRIKYTISEWTNFSLKICMPCMNLYVYLTDAILRANCIILIWYEFMIYYILNSDSFMKLKLNYEWTMSRVKINMISI